MTALKKILLSILSIFWFSAGFTQTLDVLVGPSIPSIEDNRIGIGMDEQNFYTLRIAKERRDNLGFIEVWSRSTLALETTEPLHVPVVNAEQFNILELVAMGDGVKVYYSFYSNKDELRVLAVANFDRAGKISEQAKELARSTGTTNRKTSFFRVKHFQETSITAVVELEYLYLNELTYFRPETRIMAFDGSDKLLVDQKIDWNDHKSCNLESIATDKNGNVFAQFYRLGGKDCSSVFLTVNASGVKEWCEPETTNGIHVVNDKGVWMLDGHGNQHHINFLANKKTGLVGVCLQSFDNSEGARTVEKEYYFKGDYPPSEKQNDRPSMKTCEVSKVSFGGARTLNIYGYEYDGGENGFWKLALNLDSGFEKPDVCITKRNYSSKYEESDFFNLHYLQIKGKDYLVANELKENIGKSCGELADWKGVKSGDTKTMPAYYILNDTKPFGEHKSLLPGPISEVQSVYDMVEIPGEEYIMRLKTDSKEYWLRISSRN